MRLIQKIFLSLLVVFLGLMTGLITSLSIVLFFNRDNEVHREGKLKNYQYFQLNRRTNEIQRGVSTRYEISEDFVSYDDYDSGVSVLISEFGSNEYECSGKCYCEEDRRGMSSVRISRGVSYLFASISTVLATHSAKEYFKNRCEQELSNECNNHLIRSEFDSCEEIMSSKPDENIQEESSNSDQNVENRIYWCRGNCIPNIYGQDEPSLPIKNEYLLSLFENGNYMGVLGVVEENKAKEFGCENLFFESEVKVEFPKEEGESEDHLKIARETFMDNHLEDFCVRNSIVEGSEVICRKYECFIDYKEVLNEIYFITETEIYEKYKDRCIERCGKGKFNTLPVCVSQKIDERKSGTENESVLCTIM